MNARRLVALPLAALLTIVGIVTAPPSHAATVDNLGVYGASGRPDVVTGYQSWLGRSVGYAVDFLPSASTSAANPWAAVDNPAWYCSSWAGTSWKLSLSTTMLPNRNLSLDAGARGDYDSHWLSFARTMVAKGCGDAIIRLGWEFNGTFMPWSAVGKEGTFVTYWRRIVDVLRSVPGQSFTFDWCPLSGDRHADVLSSYPGDSYVDVVGLDAYDMSTVHSSPADRWNEQVNRPFGLAWQRDFAAAHGKGLSFPEWGLTTNDSWNLGGGDNPFYIDRMYEWINANDFTYASYFEVDAKDGKHRLMTGTFPSASAEYRKIVQTGVPSTSDVPSRTKRIAGPNRAATAAAVSQALFATDGSAGAVVLARSDRFPDALAGGPLAAQKHAPVLLTAPGALDELTRNELRRVLPAGGTVYVLGGAAAIGPAVVDRLQADGYDVVRLAGANRFGTATVIAEAMGNPTTVFEATGGDFPDALAGVPAAIATSGAILLTDASAQAPETAAYLSSANVTTRYALGGQAAAADRSATAIAGGDRYATAALVAQRFFADATSIGAASASSFPDALAAGPLLGRQHAPLLPVPSSGAVPAPITAYLRTTGNTLASGIVFGGTSAVPDTMRRSLDTLL